jgi:hypothetical protein
VYAFTRLDAVWRLYIRRTISFRGKVGVVTYPLHPVPWFLSEVDELNDLRVRHDTAVLVQALVHEVELLADFDDR